MENLEELLDNTDEGLVLLDEIKFIPGGLDLESNKDEIFASMNDVVLQTLANKKDGSDLTFQELSRALQRGLTKFLVNWRKK